MATDAPHYLAMLLRAALGDTRPGPAPTMSLARRQLAAQLGIDAGTRTGDVEGALRAALAADPPRYAYTFAVEVADNGYLPPAVHATVDRSGTARYAGSPVEFAQAVLDGYLADVAADAELALGEPGSGPCETLRVLVWDEGAPLKLAGAAAVLYHPAGLPASPDVAARVKRRSRS